VTKAKTKITQIYPLGAPGSPAHKPEELPPPDAQPSELAPTTWSEAQIFACIISRGNTNVLTPEMLPKIEQARKELTKMVTKELDEMWARSVEIERAVLKGQTPPQLKEGVFRIGGLRSRALAHFLRIGHLKPENVQWDVIDGNPEGVKQLVKRLRPALEAEAASAPAADATTDKQLTPEQPKAPPRRPASEAALHKVIDEIQKDEAQKKWFAESRRTEKERQMRIEQLAGGSVSRARLRLALKDGVPALKNRTRGRPRKK
jgi:hypothetical protein